MGPARACCGLTTEGAPRLNCPSLTDYGGCSGGGFEKVKCRLTLVSPNGDAPPLIKALVLGDSVGSNVVLPKGRLAAVAPTPGSQPAPPLPAMVTPPETLVVVGHCQHHTWGPFVLQHCLGATLREPWWWRSKCVLAWASHSPCSCCSSKSTPLAGSAAFVSLLVWPKPLQPSLVVERVSVAGPAFTGLPSGALLRWIALHTAACSSRTAVAVPTVIEGVARALGAG